MSLGAAPLKALGSIDTVALVVAVVALAAFWRFGREWLANLAGRAAARRAAGPRLEQLQVRLKLSDDARGTDAERARLLGAEKLLDQILESTRLGEVDRAEVGLGYWTWTILGPSADKLLELVSPTVAHFDPRPGSSAVLRYGGEGAEEVVVELVPGVARQIHKSSPEGEVPAKRGMGDLLATSEETPSDPFGATSPSGEDL